MFFPHFNLLKRNIFLKYVKKSSTGVCTDDVCFAPPDTGERPLRYATKFNMKTPF